MNTETKYVYDAPPPYSAVAPEYMPSSPTGPIPVSQPQYTSGLPIQSQPTYGTTNITMTPVVSEVIILNSCPICRVGLLEPSFTCLGIFCAIFFFPLGVILCCLLRNKTCTNCGANFG